MRTSGFRTATAALALVGSAGLVVAAAPAQGATPSYKHCDLYNSAGDHLTAYCTPKAAGTEYRVAVRCFDGKTYYGPWRKQGGKYSSTRYCPDDMNIKGGYRQLR